MSHRGLSLKVLLKSSIDKRVQARHTACFKTLIYAHGVYSYLRVKP